MKRQVLVAVALCAESFRHPALARLPESKALSTLHFRIFKKGLRLPEARALLDGVVDLARRPVSAEERARAVAVRPASRPKAPDAAKSDLKVDEDRRD